MKIQYFADTDTLYLVFNNRSPVQTRDLEEDILVDFDDGGTLVSMTIEHAGEKTDLHDFSFQQVPASR